MRASGRRMIGVAVFSGVINILMLSGSLYMLQVYDRVIPSRNLATLFGLSLMVLIAYLVQGYFDAMRSRMLCRIATLFDGALQGSIHSALATLPLRGVKPVLMQQPLRDLDQVRTFMSGMGPTAFLDMPWIPVFLIGLFLFHPLIGFTALLGTAAIIAMTLVTERISRGATKAAMDLNAQRQVLADATQRNAEIVRALGMTDRLTARWSQANERYLQENIRATDVYANLGSAAKVLRYILQSGMLGIGAYLVIADKASGGIMIASSILMGRALAPVEIALGTWKQLAAARQGLARLRDILKATAQPPAPPVMLPRPCRELSVQNLAVAAPGFDMPIVSGVTFSLKAGAGLALLGASASGKTSLSKALVGIWPAHRGAVRLDGASLDQWRNEDLGRHIGYLPQDVGLFDGTVAENICRFDEHASSDAILKAAQIAGVHDIILRLPEGYATRIGQGGMSLSAGQKQRVGLARAVFGDPFLLVLDEPNANLDADGENALTRAIGIMRQNKSIVVVISHRPSALSALDMTMVLYEGKAIAFGPSAEVFARVRNAGGKGRAGIAAAPAAGQGRTAPITCRECFIMKGFDHVHPDERVVRRRIGGTDEDVAAPQGQALILELQRLRQAFEHDNLQDQRPPLRRPANDESRPGSRRSRQARPKRAKKKGKMGRVLDWLGPFGSQSEVLDPEPPAPRGGRSAREPQFMTPPPAGSARGPAGNASAGNSWLNERQARGPIIAPDDPSLMYIPKPRPEALQIDDRREPPRIEAPQLAPPSPAGAVPRERSVTGVVRNGLTAGVAFLANRDGSADVAGAPGESIVLRAARAFEGELRTGLAGAARRRRIGRRLDGAGAVVGRRRGAGQSGGAVQRQGHPASDRRRGRADRGQ